jgi:hypothetical protein
VVVVQVPALADVDELLGDMFVKEDVPDIFLNRQLKVAASKVFTKLNKCVFLLDGQMSSLAPLNLYTRNASIPLPHFV